MLDEGADVPERLRSSIRKDAGDLLQRLRTGSPGDVLRDGLPQAC